jgi:hypothetical protein
VGPSSLLGIAQGLLLRGTGRRHLILKWTTATIAGTRLARLIEFAADDSPFAGAILGSPLLAQIAAGMALGAIVGTASGSFQATVLRGTIARPARAAAESLSGIPRLACVAVWLFLLFGTIGALLGAFQGAAQALLRGEPGDPLREGKQATRTLVNGNGKLQATSGTHRR